MYDKQEYAQVESVSLAVNALLFDQLLLRFLFHKESHDIYRDREEDRRVPLSSHSAQRLEVSELQSGWRLSDDVSSFF